LSFRNRTTRFSSRPPTDSISQITAPTVAGLSFAGTTPTPTPTPTPTVTRATRVTRPRSVFRPSTPRITTVTRPTPPTPVTRVVSTPTPTPTRATRVTRAVSVFRPPPRDDFQRSLTPLPVVREAFAQQPPRQIQERARPTVAGLSLAPARTVTKPPRDDVAIATSAFVPVSRPPTPPTEREERPFSLTGTPSTPEDLLGRQDPSFFLSVGQQRQAGIGTAPLSSDPTARAILGGFEQVTKGVSAFERKRFEEEVLRPRGIDPRGILGEGIGGFSEFSVGFSEEIFAQGSSIINLGSFISEEVRRTGRVNIPFTDIGLDTGFEPDPLVPPRRDLFVAPTVTAEFTGGLIEGVIQGGDALALARQRAEERIAVQPQIRSVGQIGGFVLPLALGGASLIGATVKAPRAFLPQLGTTITGAPVVESVQVARGLTLFGRPIVSRIAGEGGGVVLGAPRGLQLTGTVERLASTPRFAEGLAEGGRFQQKINREVLQNLVNQGKISPADIQSFDDFARITKLANQTPVNILRGFGNMPVEHVKSGKETKALINYFRRNPELQVKGSFSQIPQIRKAGLRQAGDIDIDLSRFPDNVALSGLKADELVGVLNQASKGSGRNFFAGSGKETGKVFVKTKGGKKNKVAEFLNENDGDQALRNKSDIVFSTKGITKGLDVEGVNITRLTQQFRRKAASVFTLQAQGTKGVPDAIGSQAFRLGAPKGRFEKDAIDLYHIGKTQVTTLRNLNRVDKFKLNIKIKGHSKVKIDKFDDAVEGLRKQFPEVNFDTAPSRAVKEVLSFTKSNPLRSLASKSLKGSGKAFRKSVSVSGSGSFARELNSIFSNPSFKSPSRVSPRISPSRLSPFSPSGFVSSPSRVSIPSRVSPPSSPFSPSGSGFGGGSVFDPFPSSPSGISPPSRSPSFPRPPPTSPPAVSSLAGADPSGLFFLPQGQLRRRKLTRKERRSRLGGRLFDIADEPFGAVAVGLGFFVETQRGETSIEEALGVDDEPLTRQERQARARLGRNGGRRRRENFAEGFDFGGFFG